MNENSSTDTLSSSHHGLTAEAISRRAYELWEQEGRPESRDLHHWLRAEHALLAEQGQSTDSAQGKQSTDLTSSPESSAPRPPNTDTQPLQGTRAAAAVVRDQRPAGKRGASSSSFGSDRNSNRSSPPGGRSRG